MLSTRTDMLAERIHVLTCSWAWRIASDAKGLVRRSGSSLHPRSTSQRSIAVAASRPTSDGFESDVLRAFPQDELSERRKLLRAVLDGREMVARELAHLAREHCRPVWEQDLGLAQSARVQQQLAGSGVAGGILVAEVQGELAERDPACLSTPACLDDSCLEGQHRGEPGAGFGGALGLEARLELQAGNRYSHPGQFAIRI